MSVLVKSEKEEGENDVEIEEDAKESHRSLLLRPKRTNQTFHHKQDLHHELFHLVGVNLQRLQQLRLYLELAQTHDLALDLTVISGGTEQMVWINTSSIMFNKLLTVRQEAMELMNLGVAFGFAMEVTVVMEAELSLVVELEMAEMEAVVTTEVTEEMAETLSFLKLQAMAVTVAAEDLLALVEMEAILTLEAQLETVGMEEMPS